MAVLSMAALTMAVLTMAVLSMAHVGEAEDAAATLLEERTQRLVAEGPPARQAEPREGLHLRPPATAASTSATSTATAASCERRRPCGGGGHVLRGVRGEAGQGPASQATQGLGGGLQPGRVGRAKRLEGGPVMCRRCRRRGFSWAAAERGGRTVMCRRRARRRRRREVLLVLREEQQRLLLVRNRRLDLELGVELSIPLGRRASRPPSRPPGTAALQTAQLLLLAQVHVGGQLP
eukprot:scaffold8619_cov52-Phaeocystis_antarctica.AAC.5